MHPKIFGTAGELPQQYLWFGLRNIFPLEFLSGLSKDLVAFSVLGAAEQNSTLTLARRARKICVHVTAPFPSVFEVFRRGCLLRARKLQRQGFVVILLAV